MKQKTQSYAVRGKESAQQMAAPVWTPLVQTPAVASALPLQLALPACYGDVTPREATAAIEAAEPALPD